MQIVPVANAEEQPFSY